VSIPPGTEPCCKQRATCTLVLTTHYTANGTLKDLTLCMRKLYSDMEKMGANIKIEIIILNIFG
jgi:hypothetical protein